MLLHPPGLPAEETIEWTWQTVAFAVERKVRHVSIIPVRAGNGWVDKRIAAGEYQLPTVAMVRKLFDCLSLLDWHGPGKSVIEFDLWDWENLKGSCDRCGPILKEHIAQCNRTQVLLPFNENKIDCGCPI